MELNKIYNEDCFLTMQRMIDEGVKVDSILTSPPYNMTKRKGGYADTGRYDVYVDWMDKEQYLAWTVKLFNMFERILGENRSICYNFSYSIEHPELPYELVTEIVRNTPFALIETIRWDKKCGLPFPANGRRLSRNWEFVWVFVRKSDIDTYENNRRVKSVSEKTGQKYYEAIFNSIEAKNNDEKCPLNQATYSSELCLKLMDIYVRDGWMIYDPFIGTGTTAVAAIKRGTLDYIGSEISERQCQWANDRIKREKESSLT